MKAAGVKAADVLDGAIETIFEHVFEKSADRSAELVGPMLALLGAAYGAYMGYGNVVARDKNRAVAQALRSSLDQRLIGNPEGPRAPMVVKVRTDRIGATPLGGGGGKSSGRDVLSRL